MNISPEDLDVVAETCPWVYGTTRRGGNSGRGTARGGLHAIRATVEHLFGSPDLAGRSVLVQGAGAVGAVLARELADAGARVLVSDVDDGAGVRDGLRDGSARARPRDGGRRLLALRRRRHAQRRVDPPPRLPRDRGLREQPARRARGAERLAERGILYAPDYVVNAGGIIQLIGLEDEGWDEAQLEERLAGIGDTLRELFAEADANGITPAEAADRLAARRLAGAGAAS